MPEKSRRFGVFPEGSKVTKKFIDTGTKVEYGERTWTTAQTVRDILQNHLDANTDRFMMNLMETFFVAERLADMDNGEKEKIDRFLHRLFLLKKCTKDLSVERRKEIYQEISDAAYDLPFKEEFLRNGVALDLDKFKGVFSKQKEERPSIQYRLRCVEDGENKFVWVPIESLTAKAYPVSTHTIVGMKIIDRGRGFDSALTGFYKSTKAGKRHLRGKYGEGAKMSQTHLVRNGATLTMKSRFQAEDETGKKRILWRQRPYIDEDKMVKLRGVVAEVPDDVETAIGSSSYIDISRANQDFQDEFRRQVDPRLGHSGIGINCLEYSNAVYNYPVLPEKYDRNQGTVGVSFALRPDQQYVHGLQVPTSEDGGRFLFSYDILDSSVLSGRDRNEVTGLCRERIIDFWRHVESKDYLRQLIRKIFIDGLGTHGVPEYETVRFFMGSVRYDAPAIIERSTRAFFDVLAEELNFDPHAKNVFFMPSQRRSDTHRQLFSLLEKKKFHLIPVKIDMQEDEIKNLTRRYGDRYVFLNLEMAKKIEELTVPEVDRESESTKEVKQIVEDAKVELHEWLVALRKSDWLHLSDDIKYVPTVDPHEDVCFLKFDDESQKHTLHIRPDIIVEQLRAGGGREYWKRRIQVVILGAMVRRGEYPDIRSMRIHAQEMADILHDASMHDDVIDMMVARSADWGDAPHSSPYDQREKEKRLRAEQDREQHFLDLCIRARRYGATAVDFREMATELPFLERKYREALESVLQERMIIENGVVFFWYRDSSGLKYGEKPLSACNVLDHLPTGPVYESNGVIFMPIAFSEKSIVKCDREIFLQYRGELFLFSPDQFSPTGTGGNIVVDRGCIRLKRDVFGAGRWTEASFRQTGRGIFSRVEIVTPEREVKKMFNPTVQEIETPLPVEYGEGEWDSPRRIFEDVAQNHVDASDGKGVEEMFEVVRSGDHGGTRSWVEAGDIGTDDVIVGYAVRDSGAGYEPSGIGTMGDSSKISPLFSGKYGEGLKMLAAAAVRNGFELSYGSEAPAADGEVYRWRATAGEKEKEIYKEGKKSRERQVVFHIESEKRESNTPSTYISETSIRLSDDGKNKEMWKQWSYIIDPRQRDGLGNRGLSRFVLHLRDEEAKGRFIDMGMMRVLPDEPGNIYENGVFVRSNPDLRFGYDVPDVTKTRERNAVNVQKMKSYLNYIQSECVDERYLDTIVRSIVDTYSKKEVEVDYGGRWEMYFFGLGHMAFIPNRLSWRRSFQKIAGDKYFFSKPSLESDIQMASNLVWGGSYKDKAQLALITLANVDHISGDKLVDMGDRRYDGLEKIFPTAGDFFLARAHEELPVPPAVSDELTSVVAASAETIKELVHVLESGPVTRMLLQAISCLKPENNLDIDRLLPDRYSIEKRQREYREELDFWSSLLSLRKFGDSVFVVPKDVPLLGTVERDRIGVREDLLHQKNAKELVGTVRHELLHKVFGIGDYENEFIMLLLESIAHNMRERKET